jgi:ribonucleoside-diphosphate reductase alpha chain
MSQKENYKGIIIDYSRDSLMTDFGKVTTNDRYHFEGENDQQMFARCALAGSDNLEHAQRLYDYFSQHWAMPATPILSNFGTGRGLPISCFLNEVSDTLTGIYGTYTENCHLASHGGGIGSYWGNLRGMGAKVKHGGESSGIIPFLKVMDSSTLAVSQGNLRRGSAAVYLPVTHPEIEEFLEIRKPTGGDINRKTLNLHHGVVLTDKFMQAVEQGKKYALICPNKGEVIKRIDARTIWQKILTIRLETGEPYMLFIDTVNEYIPNFHKKAGLKVKTSNLCTEITLPTNNERTAVCCLVQANVEYHDEWRKNPMFIEDIVRFADNVLTVFIATAPSEMSKAKLSASQERSLGIGIMGFHSLLQRRNIPFECAMAKSLNKNISKYIAEQCNKATVKLAHEKGPCPDAERYGVMVRNANVTAVAPTASVSIIAGGTSPSGEPWIGNAFTHKTLSGSFLVKNKYLEKLLESKGMNNDETWKSIVINEGSVQHLECLTDDEREVYKTAFEIDQRWVIEHASVRQQFVDQAISTNVFLAADVHKAELNGIHFMAWKKGLKSLYYCRSKSLQRADKVANKVEREHLVEEPVEEKEAMNSFNTTTCLGCE